MGGLRSPYQLAAWDDTPRLGETRVVLWLGSDIQRFDYEANRWVVDREMLRIFTGSPDVIPISEEEAQWTVEHYGGTWVAPVAMHGESTKRVDAAINTMVANANSIPMPEGIEKIEDMRLEDE